jgi:hypothetical protein
VEKKNPKSQRLNVTAGCDRALWAAAWKIAWTSSGRMPVRLMVALFAATTFAVLASGTQVPLMAAPGDVAPTWGKVLVAEGFDASFNIVSSTELYDPATNTFAAPADTAVMNVARLAATATLLVSGKVLIAGGFDVNALNSNLFSTELYDPATNSFAFGPAMNVARDDSTATLLASGKVLIAGGDDNSGNSLSSTELYDPVTNSFAAAANTATMNTARDGTIATLLPSGKVLIVGGFNTSGGSYLSSTELYDPVTSSFAAAANTATMNTGRCCLKSATLLGSGKVLIAGGADSAGPFLSSTELYDPVTNSFAAAANTATMNTGRALPAVTLLGSGKVLFEGGLHDESGLTLSSTELYDPVSNSFAAAANTASMNVARAGEPYEDAVLLTSGEVLIVGGNTGHGILTSSTDLYNPATNSFAAAANTASMNVARADDVAILLPMAPGPNCSVTYNSNFTGNLVISSGLTCIINGSVTGNVTENGGGLYTSNATIGGNLQITGGGTFSMAATAVNGDVQIQNIPAGSAQNQICGTKVKGNLTFHNNGTAVAIGTTSASCLGNTIGNDLQINNNVASVQVSDDAVTGNLQCQNNSVITGGGDTAKSLQGQCASF